MQKEPAIQLLTQLEAAEVLGRSIQPVENRRLDAPETHPHRLRRYRIL